MPPRLRPAKPTASTSTSTVPEPTPATREGAEKAATATGPRCSNSFEPAPHSPSPAQKPQAALILVPTKKPGSPIPRTGFVEADLLSEVDFGYDVFGNRITKTVSDGTTSTTAYFAYDQWNQVRSSPVGTENSDVWGEFTGSSLTTRYLHGDGVDELLGRVNDVSGTPSVSWTLLDHLNSVRDVIDNYGTVQASVSYNAFGEVIAADIPGTTLTQPSDARSSSALGRYQWTGREYDAEIDLQYNRSRYYDPSVGRWILQDPLGFGAGDSNLYRYCKNNPVTGTDPSGLQTAPAGITATNWKKAVDEYGEDFMKNTYV